MDTSRQISSSKKNEPDYGVFYHLTDYASFWKRVAIALIDFAVIISLLILIKLFANPLYFHHSEISFLLFSFTYLAILKPSKIRTLGYIVTGVKIVNLKGNKPSFFHMLLRTALLLIGPFTLIFDILWLTGEPTRQTLRDKYVGTYVIKKNADPLGKGILQRVSLDVICWHLIYREVKGSNNLPS